MKVEGGRMEIMHPFVVLRDYPLMGIIYVYYRV